MPSHLPFDTPATNRVRRQNEALRDELGLSSTGLPILQWFHSEDVVFPLRHQSEDGALVFDYRCGCGVNVRPDEGRLVCVPPDTPEEIHADDLLIQAGAFPKLLSALDYDGPAVLRRITKHKPTCSRTTIAEPVYSFMPVLKQRAYLNRDNKPIHDQYVLWSWLPPIPEYLWGQLYGSTLPYNFYSQGTYEPVTFASNEKGIYPFAIVQGQVPALETTRKLIGRFKEIAERRALAAVAARRPGRDLRAPEEAAIRGFEYDPSTGLRRPVGVSHDNVANLMSEIRTRLKKANDELHRVSSIPGMTPGGQEIVR